MPSKPTKIKKSILVFFYFAFLVILMLTGAAAGINVFLNGLSITNLTDLVPWGLWITIDLSAIAMSAGAFSLCALVYLVGLKQYEPVARTAAFIGIIGYSMAMLCLLLDVGRPDRFWHGFVYWNTHSVLWEVTMCVGLYFTVLVLETLPILAEMRWMQVIFPWMVRIFKRVHHYAPVLAIFGLAFSLLHQSSLGATYAVIQSRPIWYRPNLSVLFIFSAVLGGISLTLFASMVSARLTRRAFVNDRLLEKLAAYVGWGLLAYLYFRFWDTFAMTYTPQPGRVEGLKMLTSGQLAYSFWIGEILVGILVPVFILLKPAWRRDPLKRMAALAMVAAGVVAYRWDTNMVGQLVVVPYLPQEIVPVYTQYAPSMIELLTAGGILAYGMFAFSIGVLFMKVVDHRLVDWEQENVQVGQFEGAMAD